MGMMGILKWLRKDFIQRDGNRRDLSAKLNSLNNESYRMALNAFIERRKNPEESNFILAPNSPDTARLDFFMKKSHENIETKNNINNDESNIKISKLPNAQASDIFEIGWVAGTEDRYIDLVHAEWQNTKVCLRRHAHPDCKNAVKADLDVLSEIRHPNVLLLMGITQTDDYGLMAIYEPIDCTLFNYIHEQGERVTIQGIATSAKNLAAALNHAHMLGYIHSAISSHCVFLNSSGIIKLGGWELATNINKPRRIHNYEERLRSEIFRWQAPELFIGEEASIATDIYGLTLLVWEMCTMSIPWNGLNIAEVERQYVVWKQGVIIDVYNFPPLLNNLLEVGMQLDVTKRTLDMMKMSRFLQRLEMQYEEEQSIYIEPLINKDQHKIICASPSDAQLHKSHSTSNCRLSKVKKQLSKKFYSQSKLRDDRKEKKQGLHELLLEKQKNRIKLSNKSFPNSKNQNTESPNNTKIDKKEIKDSKKPTTIFNSSFNNTDKINESDDHTDLNDSRHSIKRLKEILASKRENFFYGDNSLYNSAVDEFEKTDTTINEQDKANVLSKIRSKDYEPHKPASHKTSLEPKQITPSPKTPTGNKSTYKKKQKSPYAYVPTPIRNAVIQPQILNTDSQSFFETSLWQREKDICLSKMGREPPNYKLPSQYYPNDVKIKKTPSPASDETFVVDVNSSVDNFAQINDSINITASTIPRSKSLQALKDALERATDLARFITPITSTSNDSSPFKSPQDPNRIDLYANKLNNFGGMYKLNEEAQDDIKSIGRSSSTGTFTVQAERFDEEKLTQTKFVSQVGSLTRNSQCPIGNLNNYSNAMQKEKPDTNTTPNGGQLNSGRCLDLFLPNEAEKEEVEFLSCLRSDLRRRSLPAGFGNLRTGGYASLGKIPSKIRDLSDALVEDLYIDDEFAEGGCLAPNMILMDENTVSDEENYFPDLLENKPKSIYS